MAETLHIILDATEDELPGVAERKGQGMVTAIGGIPQGTESGKASVAVVMTLTDGSTVVGETTLALLNDAVRALAARYPDGDEPPTPYTILDGSIRDDAGRNLQGGSG
jgi:hypothetical protein